MSCNTTIKCLQIPQCTSRLKLFELPAYITGDVYVYIQNLCNGHVVKLDGEVLYGSIEVDVPINFMVECEYLLWINENAEVPHETYTFEIEGETVTILQFGVSKVLDSTLEDITDFTSQLKLA